jgi:hypothetical protein
MAIKVQLVQLVNRASKEVQEILEIKDSKEAQVQPVKMGYKEVLGQLVQLV